MLPAPVAPSPRPPRRGARAGVLLQVFLLLAPAGWGQARKAATTAILTRAEQVRRLSAEEAARSLPVRIRGVVTGAVPAPDFFVQDGTAGIFVEGSRNPAFPHHLGDLVEVEGVTGPGQFAPVVREQKSRVLGQGKLPHARLYSFSELADGQMDSQWVQVRGIVRSVSIDRTSWHEPALAMRVASVGGDFTVRVPIEKQEDFFRLVDSEVLVEGVCGSRFTAQRQLAGLLIYVPSLSFLRVEAAAQPVPISALLRFSPGEAPGHRVRVRGVVVYQEPKKALFVESEGKGLRVLTPQDTVVEVGDVVDVLGFPQMGESAPVLADAVFHRVAYGSAPAPVPLDLREPWEQYDGALVTTDATLLERHGNGAGQVLLFRAGEWVFEASLAAPDEHISGIPLNSRVRIVGICLVRSGGLWSVPQSFRVLLRSPQDVTVLRKPSWWNLRHTMWLLAIAGGVLLVLLAWVVLLGRRLREQMELLRQKLRRGAVIEERNRIARELHDTLEQDLAGITMHLDLAVDCFGQAPAVAQQALEAARDMSRHSMVEARRSVWDLRCHLLETGSLVSALRQAIEPLAARDHAVVEVRLTGPPVRLPTFIEMNLLRIGQEAVANALKHGRAGRVDVDLAYAPQKVSLRVSDDGCGFDSTQASSAGHFGLLDMRERAQAMGCALQVESRPGGGASVAVEVPVKEQAVPDEEAQTHTYPRR